MKWCQGAARRVQGVGTGAALISCGILFRDRQLSRYCKGLDCEEEWLGARAGHMLVPWYDIAISESQAFPVKKSPQLTSESPLLLAMSEVREFLPDGIQQEFGWFNLSTTVKVCRQDTKKGLHSVLAPPVPLRLCNSKVFYLREPRLIFRTLSFLA